MVVRARRGDCSSSARSFHERHQKAGSLPLYRNHRLLLVLTEEWTCEITELETSTSLPTSASASIAEGRAVCIGRGEALIDLYLKPLSSPAVVP